MAKLRQQLAKIAQTDVYVGVPEDETNRNSGAMTNAGLLYIHTHGSALQHIPARPVLEPAIEAPDNAALITKQLGEAARSTLSAMRRSAGLWIHATAGLRTLPPRLRKKAATAH